MKAAITLTIDEAALEAWLAKLYGNEDAPSTREHVAEHLEGFIGDELNSALWHDFSRKEPPVITLVELAIDNHAVLDWDWSVWDEVEA